ncbi:hypothetical protein DKX38_022541 [Salix brachista]|uniref:NADH dehydrogenase [ubiquinone] iron-sulfur protein 4, mitochondrial n=1 Tax=Salix brachista TaxID=2182728 RepID=A0A5N5K0G4_9ROSI|nr:hypothetical protein DKX38_022541 [Salix brachista]
MACYGVDEFQVIIYSPARTATQQGSGKVGRWKINFLSTQKYAYFVNYSVACFAFIVVNLTVLGSGWENPLMGWTSTGDPYANVGEAGLGFESEEAAKAFAEKHGWEYEASSSLACPYAVHL